MKSIKLIGVIGAAFLACSCSSSNVAVKESSTADSASSSNERELSSAIYEEVNQYRASQGLKQLKPHNGLIRMAQEHSDYMKAQAGSSSSAGNQKLINHYGFGARSAVAERKYRIETISENVIASYDLGQGTDLAAKMVRGWLSSSQHKHNLDSKWARTGVAVSYDSKGRAFVTQIFGTEPSQMLKVGGPLDF